MTNENEQDIVEKLEATFGPSEGLMHRQWTVKEAKELLQEVKKLRQHQGWDTENRKLQEQITSLQKERDSLRVLINERELRDAEKWDWLNEKVASLTKERDEAKEALLSVVAEYSEAKEIIKSLKSQLATANEKVEALFDKIKHGDEKHQEWLRKAIQEHFK